MDIGSDLECGTQKGRTKPAPIGTDRKTTGESQGVGAGRHTRGRLRDGGGFGARSVPGVVPFDTKNCKKSKRADIHHDNEGEQGNRIQSSKGREGKKG